MLRAVPEILLNTQFSIDYVVTPDAPGRHMTDFLWQCSRQTAEGESVRYVGTTQFGSRDQWCSDADQTWPVPSFEDEYTAQTTGVGQTFEQRAAQEQAAALFVAQRLQTHIDARNTAMTGLVRTVSAEAFAQSA